MKANPSVLIEYIPMVIELRQTLKVALLRIIQERVSVIIGQ